MLLTTQERREHLYRGRVQAAIFLCGCALLLTISVRTTLLHNSERAVYQFVYQPVRNFVYWPLRLLDSSMDHYHEHVDQSDRVVKLLEENRMLHAQTQLLGHLQAENRRLRMLMDSVLDVRLPVSVAELRDTSIDGYREIVTIGRGKADGVYLHQAVIDPYGLVGQVIDVFPHEARVMLISDARSRVPVYVERTQQRAVVAGDARVSALSLQEMPLDSDLQQGDILISSGLGGIFPRGYPVARVKRVVRDPRLSFIQVQLTPVAHLSSILEVLLLDRPMTAKSTPTLFDGPPLPPTQPSPNDDSQITDKTSSKTSTDKQNG